MADLYGSERANWEYAQLSVVVDFEELGIDPAPFQLVEHCSLFKVHSLFSLLGLSRAYVTRCGRLVGVVALKDVSFQQLQVKRIINIEFAASLGS